MQPSLRQYLNIIVLCFAGSIKSIATQVVKNTLISIESCPILLASEQEFFHRSL